MGGFILFDGENPVGILPPHHLKDYLRTRQIRITREEINDKSRRDLVSKGLILTQTAWFLLQCSARAVRRLPITELEVITLAFAGLNFITHAFWWRKPQDVGCPIPVLKVSAQDELFSEHALPHHPQPSVVPADMASVASCSQVPSANTLPHLKCNQLSIQLQTHEHASDYMSHEQPYPCVEFPCRNPAKLSNTSGPSQGCGSEGDEEDDTREGELPIVYDACRDVIKQMLEGIRACGAWGERLHLVCFVALSPILSMFSVAAKLLGHEKIKAGALNVPTFYAGNWSVVEQQCIGMSASVVGTMFGGLHFIAWSYPFPTHIEKLLWRSSTLILLCTPTFFTMHRLMVGLAYWKGRRKLPPLFGWESMLTGTLFMVAMILYVLARTVLITLAIISLRALPPGAYQTVSWTYFIPHV
jgi:hypothetical protein